MIDTNTTFKELARLLGKNPDSFYSRVSVAKYYETSKGGKNGLPWNWQVKVGIENQDSLFSAKLTSFGILNLHASNIHIKEQLRRVVQSYDDYLKIRMPKVIGMLNKDYLHPVAKTGANDVNTLDLFSKFAKATHHNIGDFFSRLTVSKHYETIEENETDNPWYWSDKFGLKDGSFSIHMTRYGIEDPNHILENHSNLNDLLVGYDHYLRVIMKPIYQALNKNYINPAD